MPNTNHDSLPIHPRGKKARVLLTSVFGPYAQDDVYGSRKINPMELYHNQVTRFQQGLSLRMFHRSFGLMLIQKNIEAPCTLLDFPTRKRFIAELQQQDYDIVGISAIIPNLEKAAEMCALVRRYRPRATIVVGGHVANKEDIHQRLDADFIVKGDGVGWMRRFIGQDPAAVVKHPMAYSAHSARIMGVSPREKTGDTAAILIPSVGCPVGCNFCSTSALFGGKGHHINFYETGDELFKVMCQLEERLKTKSFFILDENFLLHRQRALRLLALMEARQKSWSLYVFSSARVLQSYDMAQLVGLGLSYVWMGLEGRRSRYQKLAGVDTRALVKRLQANGIRVLGSSIIGLEDHTPENIDGVIDYAVSHETDFHQFMLYTPIPGTPLYAQHKKDRRLYAESRFALADTHGQYRFNYRHGHIPEGQEETFLRRAFQRDMNQNGPSLARMIATQFKGWQKHRAHPNLRIRRRFEREARLLASTYAGAVWAMRKKYRGRQLTLDLDWLLKSLYRSFGIKTRAIAPVIGRYLYATLKREEKRLAAGLTYEPPCFYEKHAAARGLARAVAATAKLGGGDKRWGLSRTAPETTP